MANKKDYYDVLGLSKSATEQELKSAYRKKAKKLHPDINKTSTAEKDFKELNEAYDVLKDSKKRQAYDQFGHRAGANQSNFGKGGGFGGFNGDFSGFSQQNFGGGQGFNFQDIFEDFLNPFGGRRKSNDANNAQQVYILLIDFMVAVHGGTKNITVESTEKCSQCHGTGAENIDSIFKCNTCAGSGHIQQSIGGLFSTNIVCPKCRGEGRIIEDPCKKCHGKKVTNVNKVIKVKIPAGIRNDQFIKIKSAGQMLSNGTIGDLYVQIKIQPHHIFQIENECDIVVVVPLNYLKAAIGCKITVPTTVGYETISIPDGTQNLQRFKIKNVKGMKNNTRNHFFNNKSYGDFWVEIHTFIPNNNKYSREELVNLKKIANSIKDGKYEKYLREINNLNL